jgi:hypothetical protein
LAGCSSSVYALFAGGEITTGAGGYSNAISYVTIATTGNSASWGQLTQGRWQLAACSNNGGGLQ